MNKTDILNNRIKDYKELFCNVHEKQLLLDVIDNLQKDNDILVSYILFINKNGGRELIFNFFDSDENQLFIRIFNKYELYFIYLSEGLTFDVPRLDDIQDPKQYIERIMDLDINYFDVTFKLSDIDFDFIKFNNI